MRSAENNSVSVKPQEAANMLMKRCLLIAVLLPAGFGLRTDRTAAADASTRPAETTTQPKQAAIRFQFEDQPFSVVIARFARMVGKPLIGKLDIEGRLTFYDEKPYTYEEALETLNLILSTYEYTLLEQGRYLRLARLKDVEKLPVKIVTRPDQAGGARPNQIVTMMLPVEHIRAADAHKAVSRLVSPFGSSQPLPDDRGVLLTDTLENIRRMQRVLKSIDTPTIEDTRLRVVALKRASASSVSKVLSGLFRGQADDKKRGKESEPAIGGRINVIHDDRTNSVFLVGSEDDLRIAEQVIQTLDAAKSATDSDMRVYELQNAKAEELADVIGKSLPRETKGEGKKAKTVQVGSIVPDPVSNRLIVSVPVEMLPKVERLIRELDEAATSAGSTKIFHLEYADAQQLAAILPKVVAKRDARGRLESSIAVSADARTNSIMVTGSVGDLKTATTLLGELDEPDQTDRRMRVIEVDEAHDATPLARSLKTMFNEQGRRDRRRGAAGEEPTLRVEADETTNSLIISAEAEDWPRIEQILHKLTVELPPTVPTIRQYQLEHAQAGELAAALAKVFRARRREDDAVTVAPSEQNNSLIIRAKPDQHRKIEQLIASLDAPETARVEPIRMIQLRAADAEKVAETLRSMLPSKGRREQDVFIQAETLTNTILIRAPESQRQMLEQMIASLETATKERAQETRILPLQYVSAEKMVESLAELYQGGQPRGRRRRSQDGEDEPVTFAAAPDDEAVIVEAPRDQMEHIAQLVASLDAPASGPEMDLRTYDVGASDAGDLVRSLRHLFGRDKRNADSFPRFEADPASNRLIVAGNKPQFDQIEKVLRSVTAQSTPTSRMSTFYLTNAQAEDVAEAVKTMFQEDRRTRRSRRSDAGPDEPDVRVAAVSFTNAVLVKAPAEMLDQAATLIQDLDAQARGQEPVVRTYELQRGDVGDTVQTLRELFVGASGQSRRRRGGQVPEQIQISGDERGRTIIVSAPAPTHKLIGKTIEQLDTAAEEATRQVRIYPLTHGDAGSVADALVGTLTEQTSGRSRRQDRSAGDPRITAEPGSNCLVVRATAQEHTQIAELIEQMDRPDAGEMPIHVLRLEKADPTAVANVLRGMFTEKANRRDRRETRGVAIEADEASGVLMVRADQASFRKIEELARSLDTADASDEHAIITLEHADAARIAPALVKAFQPKKGQRLPPEDQVTIASEPTSNSIIVSAGKQNLQKIRSLLDRLDSPETGESKTEMVLLANAEAKQVAQALSAIAQAGKDRRRRGAPREETVVISADEGANALLLTGPGEEVEEFLQMAARLDEATSGKETRIFVIQLLHSEAAQVAEIVRDIHAQHSEQAKRAHKAADPLAVSADERANALILSTTPEQFKQVSLWVTEVEKMKPSRGAPRIIKLKEANPDEAREAIEQLFGASSQTTGRTRRRRSNRRGRPDNPSSSDGVRITALPQQRALLLDATDEEYEQIRALLEAMEQAARQTKKSVRIFTVENAANARVAAALNQMYRALGEKQPQDEVSVTALEKTNAVVVAASPEKMEEVARLIEQLDKREVSPQLEFRIYPLEHVTPSKVLPMLRKMLATIKEFRPDEIVDAQADDRTRSIIVTTRADVFDQIDKLIDRLDTQPAYAAAEVLVIPLKRADAEQLAKVLKEMLRPSDSGQVTAEALALQEQIRRLRVRSPNGQTIPDLDLTKPIKISADPARPQGSNALILSSTSENLRAMAAIVELMDTVPVAADVKVRLIPLVNADAESVKAILDDVFEQAQDLAGKPGTSVAGLAEPTTISGQALVHRPNISVDPRTNTLIISGREKSIALAEVVARDLDRNEGKITTQVRLFKLREADATKLAPILQAVFAEGKPEPGLEGLRTQVSRLESVLNERKGHATTLPRSREALTVQAEASTNIIVVAARSDVMPLIADVIRTMDLPGAGSLSTVRVFPLTHADATRLSDVVGSLYSGPNARLIRDEDKPTMAVDTRTNALVVSASPKTFSVLEGLLERLDTELPPDVREIRLVRLEHADAASLAPALQEMMDARVQRQESLGAGDAEALRVVIAADPRSNSLMAAGSAESFEIVKSLAERLDTTAPALAGQIQVLPLDHANAGRISTTLNNLFDQRYQTARLEELQRQKPVIVPDLRTNSLLLAAGADDTRIIRNLLDKLDREQLDPAVQLIVIPLNHNDAGTVAETIRMIFHARLESMTPPGEDAAPQDRVDVATDALTNSLIVSASKENLTLIRGLLEKVDVAPPEKTGIVRMYFLRHCDAARVAEMVKSLIQQGLYRPGIVGAADSQWLAARENVAVEVDTRTNVLIVSASNENLAVIEEIIHRIDSSEDFAALGDIRLYRLEHADATEVAPTLQQFFNAKHSAEKAADGSARSLPVSVLADARSNTLLVAGSHESFAAIEKMIERLDSDDASRVNEIRLFELDQADATALAEILTEVLAGEPAGVGEEDPDRQMLLRFVARTEAGKQVVAEGLRKGLLVIPDARNNSVVVCAPEANMPMISTMIRAMDATSPRSANIRVFRLDNADATRMADVLRRLFRLDQEGAEGRSVQYTLATTQPTEVSEAAKATVGTDEQQAFSVTVDVRTNSLLVGGTKHQLEMAGQVIEQLDSIPAQERMAKVYRLRNARAADIEAALRSFLDQERERLLATLGDDRMGAARRLLEREVAVVAVASEGEQEKSNTLLLSASPRYFQIVEEMIQELDQPPPQVRVQVLLAEVTLDDKSELGVDWNYTHTFNDNVLNAGTSFGVSASDTGFSISITGGDVRFFLRALQSQGRLQVLSRPQILTSDNQRGEVTVGKRVPFVRESRITESGTTLSTIQYEDVGINLYVTPRINPDGFVRLEVEPEISSLSESTVQVSEGVNAIIVNNRSAKTTVTVQDGHTIIIGGLITTKDENREDKVPFLGDLPLLGDLFKASKIINERTELLIILTPHVLRTTEQADAITQKGLERLRKQGRIVKEYQQRQDWLNTLERISPVRPYESDWEEHLRELEPNNNGPVPLEEIPESGLKNFNPKDQTR